MSIVEDLPLCLSGGASGADLEFGKNASLHGHDVIHFTFHGLGSKAPNRNISKLEDEQLKKADSYMIEVNKILKRTFPSNCNFTNNIIRRNYFQIEKSTSLYAVSYLKDNMVQGGTAWATYAFINKFKKPCNAFLFDQTTNQWFKYVGCWINCVDVPIPSGVYTGIGSRDSFLTETGRNAIKELYCNK